MKSTLISSHENPAVSKPCFRPHRLSSSVPPVKIVLHPSKKDPKRDPKFGSRCPKDCGKSLNPAVDIGQIEVGTGIPKKIPSIYLSIYIYI